MQVGPRAYSDLPPFLFWLEGKIEQVILKNINNYQPINDQSMIWIQPDAKN